MIPPTDKTGSLRSERRRDSQQWLLDWMVKTTGRTHNFAYDHREIPPEVKTYRQIPRVMEKTGMRLEATLRELAFFPSTNAQIPAELPPGIRLEADAVQKQATAKDAMPSLLPIGLGAKNGELNKVYVDTF